MQTKINQLPDARDRYIQELEAQNDQMRAEWNKLRKEYLILQIKVENSILVSKEVWMN